MTLIDIAGPFGAGMWTIETSICMAFVGLIAGLVWFKSQSLVRWQCIGGFFAYGLMT